MMLDSKLLFSICQILFLKQRKMLFKSFKQFTFYSENVLIFFNLRMFDLLKNNTNKLCMSHKCKLSEDGTQHVAKRKNYISL